MARTPDDNYRLVTLRSRAVAHLSGPSAEPRSRSDASAAFGVLYDLASSPSTAPGALALLHELQVHQVEVDMQDEELRRSRVELETQLNRHLQIYDDAPFGYFTVDRDTALRELNLAGAKLLGFDCDVLRGRLLNDFLSPDSVRTLRDIFGRVHATAAAQCAELHLRGLGGDTRMHASVCQDPAGAGFLIALMGYAGDDANVRSRTDEAARGP